jgi:hypothetical protein
MKCDNTQTSQPAQPEFLNTAQLLAKLPISRRTLYSHRVHNRIPYVQLGDRILFHWDSVKESLLRQQTTAANERR